MQYGFDEFTYWFRPTAGNGIWEVYFNRSEPVGVLLQIGTEINVDDVALASDADKEICKADFQRFMTRPEYRIYCGHEVDLRHDDLVHEYEQLLSGAFLAHSYNMCETLDAMKEKASKQGEMIEMRLKSMLDWLTSTDFYAAPASSRYHEAYSGGLLVHSLKVYNRVLELMNADSFKKVSMASAALVALTHDWCKINYYESYMKNVKDEATGQWNKEMAFRVNQKGVPLGHGVTSMFLVSKFFNLTPDEALAIRWHMGHWRVPDQEVDELQKANETCPLVHLIQFADQLAITNY